VTGPKWEDLLSIVDALTPRCEVCRAKLPPEERSHCFLDDGRFLYYCEEHQPDEWNGTRLTFE